MINLVNDMKKLPLEKQLGIQTAETPDDDWWRNEKKYIIPVYDTLYINNIMEELHMCRTRVMRMAPCSTYSFHKDLTPRIHIPIQTDEKAVFIIEDKIYRLKPTRVYWVDTTREHNFVNGSYNERIHIVGAQG